MVLDVLRRQQGLTASERLVANYLLAHPGEIGSLTAAELSSKALTSKSCVMRLVRKVGCATFAEFKHAFAVEWSEYARMHQLVSREPFRAESSTDEVINGLGSIYERVLLQASLKLDHAQVERVVGQMQAADTIRLHGTGVCLSLAQVAAFKLEALGKHAVATDGVNEHYLSYATGGQRTCAFFLSFTGGNAAMVSAAKRLRSKGLYTVGVGQPRSQSLLESCDEYFDLGQDVPVLSLEAVESTVLVNYVLDVLITCLMVRDYNRHLTHSLEVFERDYGSDKTWKRP